MTVSHPNYEDYPCLISNPLQCDRPQQTVGEVEKAKFCMDCGFPTTLALRRDLKGRVGTYRVQQWLGTRGWGRLYLGQRAVDSQPVLIKEYLLPRRSFTADEAHRRQETFLRVAGIRPIDERNQDFRLMPVLDTFADRPSQEEKQLIYRCYLISADLRNSDGQRSLTLREYLKQRGIMTLVQVRECLQQTLQTLYFLHHQQLRFPSGQICQGIAHGNLTLDSLILREVENRFYIYFCDLGIWEHLFAPTRSKQAELERQNDLTALGRIIWELRTGRPPDWSSNYALNLLNTEQLFTADPHLTGFLKQLMGLEQPFTDADAARQTLIRLPPIDWENTQLPAEDTELPEKKRNKIWWVIGILALLLLAGQLRRILFASPSPTGHNTGKLTTPKFKDVGGIPEGICRYGGQAVGAWSFLLDSSPFRHNQFAIFKDPEKFSDLLEKTLPPCGSDQGIKNEFRFSYQKYSEGQSFDPRNPTVPCAPIQAIWGQDVEFAITSLRREDWQECPTLEGDVRTTLKVQTIGYNALFVFIASPKTQPSLLRDLDGKIHLRDLRKIYTGEINNWEAVGGPNLPIQPYAPEETEAIYLFWKTVLNGQPFTDQLMIQRTEDTLKQIQLELDQTDISGIVSFGIVGRKINQCSGYTLALVTDQGQTTHPLIQENGKPITPDINLCNDRLPERIHYNMITFKDQSYPLGYPIQVVYPNDNSRPEAGLKFGELLQTQEGQQGLYFTVESNKLQPGIVPLQPVLDDD